MMSATWKMGNARVVTITQILESREMQSRLSQARGEAPMLMVYRAGASERSAMGDDGRCGSGVEDVQTCFDDIAAAAGLEIADANAFCTKDRTTLTVKLSIAQTTAELAVYHDTATGVTEYQVLHPEPVTITIASHSDLLMLAARPASLLEHHFDAHVAKEVEDVLDRLGLTVVPPDGREMEYEAHCIKLGMREVVQTTGGA